MNTKEIEDKLRDDNNYYGEFGKQYLSNSDIDILLNDDPLKLKEGKVKTVPMLIGGYFHTCVLEPEKVKSFKIIESTTRNTKLYKELSGGEMCLLQHEADIANMLTDKILKNKYCESMIFGSAKEHEVPAIKNLEGNWWKGKADVLNHDDKFIVDLKTTSNLSTFRSSAKRYNYDSQAYIYQELFGYEMIFIVIDKTNLKIKVFDCSNDFIRSGKDKVLKATEVYDLYYKTDGFDPSQYFLNETL
tara:strand:- start:1290 stop:2024 length:735 start_codon:yes stop_codon:yes gene_type:complete